VTTTVTCYSWIPSSGDHLFTCGAIFWSPHMAHPALVIDGSTNHAGMKKAAQCLSNLENS